LDDDTNFITKNRRKKPMAVEVELKTRIDEPEALKKRLDERGSGKGAYEKEDRYWFFAGKGDGKAPDLPPSGLRVRRETSVSGEGESSGRTLITYKIRELREGVELNDEREFEVSDAGVFEDLLRRLGLAPGIGKHKRGQAWSCGTESGPVRAELSEVRGLGWYLELEVLAAPGDEGALEAAQAGLFSLLEDLGIPKERIEARPYTEMLRALEEKGKYNHT
jgi:adenylate cyclase class 2